MLGYEVSWVDYFDKEQEIIYCGYNVSTFSSTPITQFQIVEVCNSL